MLRVILYTRAVQEVCRHDFTHFMEVGSEVSMTAQKLTSVKTTSSVCSVSRSSALSSPRSKPFTTSYGYGASLGVLPPSCANVGFPRVHTSPLSGKKIDRDNPSNHHNSWFRDGSGSRGYTQRLPPMNLGQLLSVFLLVQDIRPLLKK